MIRLSQAFLNKDIATVKVQLKLRYYCRLIKEELSCSLYFDIKGKLFEIIYVKTF